MEDEKLIQTLTKSIGDKLKRPIIITYICVLILYNWDIIFYILFEKISASEKINFIKLEYSTEYFNRILTCIAISVILIVLFTILNTLLNLSLKWFYRKDKEITSEIDSYEKLTALAEQLSSSIDENKQLNSKIENLEKINKNLSIKKKSINVSQISEKDYTNLLSQINIDSDKEKLLFSLNELLKTIKTTPKIALTELNNKATYKHHMKKLINILINNNLIEKKVHYDENRNHYEGISMSKSFEDFLKFE